MTEAEKNHLFQWIEKAEHDLIAAKLIVDHQPLILDIACFHCQQAVEKYLKNLLSLQKRTVSQDAQFGFTTADVFKLLSRFCSYRSKEYGRLRGAEKVST
jgi:hypothetical protein